MLKLKIFSLLRRQWTVLELVAFFVVWSWILPPGAWAKPTTAGQVQWVVQTWLALSPRPLETSIGQEVLKVQPFWDKTGQPLYYVVYLKPAGLVLVPGDDLVEPIVGFSPGKIFDPSPANPLGALASRDLAGRVKSAREAEAAAQAEGRQFPQGIFAEAKQKWALLEQAPVEILSAPPLPSINDPRRSPLMLNYNWYQMLIWAAPINKYVPAGCVAVAMGQLMRFNKHPASSTWTTASRYIYIKDIKYYPEIPERTYNWAGMPLTIPTYTHNTNRLNIYRILHDAGLSVHMNYDVGGSGISSMFPIVNALKTNFRYANARSGYNAEANLLSVNRNKMINPNLDARLPVLLGIVGGGKHAVVVDGYGYNLTTPYHHLNLGWADNNNVWYNLPNVATKKKVYNSVTYCIYNIFKSGIGEILSGRAVDSRGKGLPGVTVKATFSSNTRTTTTDYRGIYAFKNVPSNTTVVVEASKTGYDTPPELTVTTGASNNQAPTTGNVWPVNFEMIPTQ